MLFVCSKAYADVAVDLTSGHTLQEAAANAYQADEAPDATTQAMIDAGQHPARSALAVSSTWNSCEATMQSVRVATRASPESVGGSVVPQDLPH